MNILLEQVMIRKRAGLGEIRATCFLLDKKELFGPEVYCDRGKVPAKKFVYRKQVNFIKNKTMLY